MWKRFLNKIDRYRSPLTEGIAIIGTVVAVLAVFLPENYTTPLKFVLVAGLVIVIALFAIFRRAAHMAEPENRTTYYINIPCNPAELDQAIEIAQYYFGRHSMKPEMVRAAYRINPFSFIVIKDSGNKVVGYLDHFGLTPESFDDFLAGNLSEDKMTAANYASGEDISKSRRAYIGGVAVMAKSKFEVGRITQCLLTVGCDLLMKRYLKNDAEFDLYATGYSKEGRDMLVALGFGIFDEGKTRADKTPVYWRKVSRKIAAQYKQNHPVCKAELVVKYEQPAAVLVQGKARARGKSYTH